jgi:rod shape-determining protein MreB and related proteins
VAEVGIDLGTATTVVCHPRDGVVHDEPTLLIEWPGRRGSELLLGAEAMALLGRTPARARIGRPVRGGAVTDLALVRTYLAELVRRTSRGPWARRRTRAVLSCPVDATPLERRALVEAADEAGLARADLVPAPLAGALGCGVDVTESRVHVIVDVGAGTAEIAVFCRGAVLARRSCRQAGDEAADAVRRHLREAHGLHVTDTDAGALTARSAAPASEPLSAEGRDARSGKPRVITVEAAEIELAVAPVTSAMIATLATCLDDLPVAAVSDLLKGGIVLLGGGALSPRVRDGLESGLGLPVKVPERPTTCVAEGLARATEHRDLLAALSG